MTDKPEPIETTQTVGKDGGMNVKNAPPPETEDVVIDPTVGKGGGETTLRHER